MPKKLPPERWKPCLHQQQNGGRDLRDLRRKENFACVRIFYWGAWRKTENLDVARIGRERTRNKTWFTRDRSAVR